MARMIPPYISEDVKSTGEKQIFELFKNDPETEDWVVLHSLGLSRHSKRLYGEIDFVIMAPGLGIFCLEVKSGDIKRKQGQWVFTNRFGERNKKTRGPFEQAMEGMFSLLEAIQREFGKGSRLASLLFGYGVMFPHVNYNPQGLEQEWWQIYDRDSRRYPVSRYIKQLSKYTRKKVINCKWFKEESSMPDKKDINKLLDFLRGDFERIVKPGHLVDEIEEQIMRYTNEQYACLDQLQDNPRCLFQGAAGTGKTMLAMESARRGVFEGKRVLLLCYNKLLGAWMKKELQSFEKKQKIVVSSFHKFLRELSLNHPEFKEDTKCINSSEYFRFDLPLMALTEVDKGAIEPFDRLVIDEGQDLITNEYLDVLDTLVTGGLSGGNWQFFCDFEKQAIYSELNVKEMFELLNKRSNFVRFRLTINCRNTKPIGEETSFISGFEKPPFLPGKITGPPVEYYFCKDRSQQVSKIDYLLSQLMNKKIKQEHITILSTNTYEKSVCRDLSSKKYHIDILKTNNFEKKNTISFCTIQSFKGLENYYIVITDINRLLDDDIKSLLYVGMSRARLGLYVFLDSCIKKDFDSITRRRIKDEGTDY